MHREQNQKAIGRADAETKFPPPDFRSINEQLKMNCRRSKSCGAQTISGPRATRETDVLREAFAHHCGQAVRVILQASVEITSAERKPPRAARFDTRRDQHFQPMCCRAKNLMLNTWCSIPNSQIIINSSKYNILRNGNVSSRPPTFNAKNICV